MAIIYSYPKVVTLNNSDLLIGSRFENEDGGEARTISFTAETLTNFIEANLAPTLDEVLTNGNESLQDAKIGNLYLYDNSENEYGQLAISDSGLVISDAEVSTVARIDRGGIILVGTVYNSSLLTGSITANRNYTLPNNSGTIALTSDITSLNLNQVLTAGNESLLNAKIGEIYLYNPNVPSGNGYVYITGDKNRFNFYNNADVNYGYIAQNSLSFKDPITPWQFIINTPSGIAANRTATFQDASGTIAYLSDIPSTTNYGLATQLANSTPIANTIVKSTLNSSSYAGTLSVPANGFSIGDSFNAYMMGHISNNNNVGLTITIETVAGVVLATTGLMSLAVSSNNHWVLNADFVIRATGTAGVASIITAGSFAHSKSSNNNLETYNFISENTTTFNTTIASELVIKAQWGTASASNSIYSNVFILNKVY
jgi:hypothetical protein